MIQKRTFENVEDTFKNIVVTQLGVGLEEVTGLSVMSIDHGADSLDVFELVMAVEDEFGISIEDKQSEDWGTKPIQDIVAQVAKQLGIKPAGVAA